MQQQQIRMGEVEFYGAAGVDLGKVRAALPFREGDPISLAIAEQLPNCLADEISLGGQS